MWSLTCPKKDCGKRRDLWMGDMEAFKVLHNLVPSLSFNIIIHYPLPSFFSRVLPSATRTILKWIGKCLTKYIKIWYNIDNVNLWSSKSTCSSKNSFLFEFWHQYSTEYFLQLLVTTYSNYQSLSNSFPFHYFAFAPKI